MILYQTLMFSQLYYSNYYVEEVDRETPMWNYARVAPKGLATYYMSGLTLAIL